MTSSGSKGFFEDTVGSYLGYYGGYYYYIIATRYDIAYCIEAIIGLPGWPIIGCCGIPMFIMPIGCWFIYCAG